MPDGHLFVRWKLAQFITDNELTGYEVFVASGLSKSSLYSMIRGTQTGVQLDTLARLLDGLEKLIGKPVALSDVLIARRFTEAELEKERGPTTFRLSSSQESEKR